jgi:hypothetical protein
MRVPHHIREEPSRLDDFCFIPSPSCSYMKVVGKSGNGGFKRSHPVPRLSPMSKVEEDKFLKDNNLCTKCSWILSENGSHQCNPAQRAMRLKGMRMDPRGLGAKPETKNARTSA